MCNEYIFFYCVWRNWNVFFLCVFSCKFFIIQDILVLILCKKKNILKIKNQMFHLNYFRKNRVRKFISYTWILLILRLIEEIIIYAKINEKCRIKFLHKILKFYFQENRVWICLVKNWRKCTWYSFKLSFLKNENLVKKLYSTLLTYFHR